MLVGVWGVLILQMTGALLLLYFNFGRLPGIILEKWGLSILVFLPVLALMAPMLLWKNSMERRSYWLVTKRHIRIMRNSEETASLAWRDVSDISFRKGNLYLTGGSPKRRHILRGISKEDYKPFRELWRV